MWNKERPEGGYGSGSGSKGLVLDETELKKRDMLTTCRKRAVLLPNLKVYFTIKMNTLSSSFSFYNSYTFTCSRGNDSSSCRAWYREANLLYHKF